MHSQCDDLRQISHRNRKISRFKYKAHRRIPNAEFFPVYGEGNLHLFTVRKMRIGICPDGNVDDLPPNFYFEEDVCLELILLNVKKFLYEYDFGDGWAVTIYVEKAEEVQKVSPPRLINICGGMACDDCGGPNGLAELPPIAADIGELNLILEETFDQ